MDRNAFKLRMQALKSYRENNPGKGYIQFMEELAKAKSKEWKENEDLVLLQMLNDNTYNYRLMYEDNPNYNIQEGHFNDTYKTVYHPTFSEESTYSGKKSQYNPEGITGGWWDYDNKLFHAGPKLDIIRTRTQEYLDEADPGWKVRLYEGGGTSGYYSNHSGTPTMYVPVTKDYEATPEGFGEIANVHTPEVTITANAPKTDAQRMYEADQYAGLLGVKGLELAEGIAEYTDYGDVKELYEIYKLYRQGRVKEAAEREAEYMAFAGAGALIPFVGWKALRKISEPLRKVANKYGKKGFITSLYNNIAPASYYSSYIPNGTKGTEIKNAIKDYLLGRGDVINPKWEEWMRNEDMIEAFISRGTDPKRMADIISDARKEAWLNYLGIPHEDKYLINTGAIEEGLPVYRSNITAIPETQLLEIVNSTTSKAEGIPYVYGDKINSTGGNVSISYIDNGDIRKVTMQDVWDLNPFLDANRAGILPKSIKNRYMHTEVRPDGYHSLVWNDDAPKWLVNLEPSKILGVPGPFLNRTLFNARKLNKLQIFKKIPLSKEEFINEGFRRDLEILDTTGMSEREFSRWKDRVNKSYSDKWSLLTLADPYNESLFRKEYYKHNELLKKYGAYVLPRFIEGGETGEQNVDGEIGREEKDFLRDWFSKRRLYSKLNAPLMLRSGSSFKDTRSIDDLLNSVEFHGYPSKYNPNIGVEMMPIDISDDKIKESYGNSDVGGYYQYETEVVLPRKYKQWYDREPLLHELSHIVNTANIPIYEKVNSILEGKAIKDRGEQINLYLTDPAEVHSRLMEFRKLNNLDPLKTYGLPDIELWRKTGRDADLLNTFDDDTILELLNGVAYNQDAKLKEEVLMAEYGGETGEPDIDFTTSLNTRLGRTPSGTPKELGLQPAFSLRDFFDFTPVGDAVAVNDTYQAAKEGDWLGAGLAALTVLPFVPSSIKSLRKTPSVRRTGMDQIDRITKAKEKEIKMATRLNNETYNIAERLMDDPSYIRRAQLVKDKYGDDYVSAYADIINAYNETPELLPKAKGSLSLGEARGRMLTTAEATKRHKQGGDFPGMGEYEYVFDIDRGVPYGSTIHEGNHYTDFLTNKAPDAVGNSNIYRWMRSAIKPYADNMSKYFASPTEQKAYMNQLREFMYANKMISTRDEIVTPDLIKLAIGRLPKGMDAVKKAFNLFKSAKSYTKWYNTVPLLGVGAIGANRYFTDNENNKI